MTRTFAYLILTIFRNRLAVMARRVRRPRYAIGLILGIAYVGFFIYGQSLGAGETRGGLLQNDATRVVAPVVILLMLATTWFGGATLNALAFTQAEVSLLFPAPVSRRALVLYKLGSAQLPIIINAVILAFVFGRGPTAIPRWLAVASLWTTISTMHLHRLGAALTFAATAEHGRSGFRRNWFSHLITFAVFATVMGAFTLISFEADSPGASPLGKIDQLIAPLAHPAVRAVLSPFTLMLAPAFARSVGEWTMAMGPALLLLALHLVWVLRSQVAFEEAAVEASARRHRAMDDWRKRGAAGVYGRVRESRTIALGSRGRPAFAIVWKNTLCFLRTVKPMQLLATMGVPIVVGGYLGMKANQGALAIAGLCTLVAVLLLLGGGSAARNDLRADMLNLAQLKTLPLRGRELVFAEVLSSAIPLALMQLALLVVATVALQLSARAVPTGTLASIAISLPFVAAGLNLVLSTIRNGVAVLFPSWIRLGVEGGASGFEIVGQQMLSMLAVLLTFLVLMIVPAGVTLVVTMYVQPPAAVSIVFSSVVGAAALAAESYALVGWLGRVFERAEPAVSLTAS